jgi:hypothetical protein
MEKNKSKDEIQVSQNMNPDFSVVKKDSIASNLDNSTVLITDMNDNEACLKRFEDAERLAMSTYDPTNRVYSAQLNNDGTSSTLTQSLISTLGENAQYSIENIKTINRIIRKFVNTNDLIGMVVQSIQNNVNTEFKLSYKNVGEQKRKVKMLEKAKMVINDFNEQVNLELFIQDAIVTTYVEGNYCAVLREVKNGWKIDYYPLSIIENSGYEVNGNPVLLVNLSNLKSALQKTMIKSRNGKYLFFKDTADEIKNNYPPEVSKANASNETYAVLDDSCTGMIRVNTLKGKYGLSPIFRALSPALVLDDYQAADETNAKAKAKKIIHQKMREKCLGENGERKAYPDMAYAHSNLMKAWSNKTVVVTTPPTIESIEYVEPKTADTPVENINIYRNKVLSSLGVAFLAADKSQTANTANINLSQLMRCINSISKQVETVIKRFYIYVLDANGITSDYCPNIRIIDSEMLDMKMRTELAKLLYTTFGSSRETAFDYVGIDIEDERAKREIENQNGDDETFRPHITSYTANGNNNDNPNGRPLDKDSQNPDKQQTDQNNRSKNK